MAEDNTVGSLSEEQRSVIIGSLLGDGAMRCKTNALLEVNHCEAQRAYVDWKYQRLVNLVRTPPKARRGNGTRVAYRFVTLSVPELTPFYREFYSGGRKSIPEGLVITPLILAVWFMDDGCKSRRALYLNTQQFATEDQERLVELLSQQWHIKASLNRDKTYARIRISVSSVSRFRDIVVPHLLPGFQYKLPT
jgi:recombination protein RecA